MAKFQIVKNVDLQMTIEVEADTLEEAYDKIDDAWANNEMFVQNYLQGAEVIDDTLDENPDATTYTMTLEEMC